MGSPLPFLSILAAYLVFVNKLGPWLMRDRPAFDLKKILIAYNLGQIILCTYTVSHIRLVEDAFSWLFSFGCRFNLETDRPVARVVCESAYWYLIAKLMDLFDTVFFVLRKKSNQITFLHVYHHTLTFSVSWIYLKYIPGKN